MLGDEFYKIREPRAEDQIAEAAKRPFPRPEFIVIGPGMSAIGGLLGQLGYYKRTSMANVEESIKHVRQWLAADENGHRRIKVHPRCVHLRYEMARYKRDDIGRIVKAFDHGPDSLRGAAWVLRNGW